MADDTNKAESGADMTNPVNRDRLRKAADELLKADRAARRRSAAEDADTFADLDEPDASAFEFDDAVEEDAAASVAAEIQAIQSENADMKDRLLRLAADMENLRRRTQREISDAKSFAIANFARDMLSVSDNLHRAMDAVTAEQREAAGEAFKTLLEGVELTERSMMSTMERHGVKKLEPEGQKFDPNFHQAMFEVQNPEVPNNTVFQVVQAGYQIGDRVLRPAMVGVAKGGPKLADNEAEPGPPNEQAERDA